MGVDHLNEIKNVARSAYGEVGKSKEFGHYWNTANILLENCADVDTVIAGLFHGLPVKNFEKLRLTKITLQGKKNSVNVNVESVNNILELLNTLTHASKIKVEAGQLIDLITQANDPRAFLVRTAEGFEKLKALEERKEKGLKVDKADLNTRIGKVNAYIPIAQALNYYKLVSDMEDSVFKLENREAYDEITKWMGKQNHEEKLLSLKRNLLGLLGFAYDKTGRLIPAGGGSLVDVVDVQHRVKNASSTFRKSKHRGVSFKDVHDVKGLRIILKRDEDVTALAELLKQNGFTLASEKYMPRNTPAEKNYVEKPKSNGYRAFHLIGWLPGTKQNAENLVELQIAGENMHALNEYGPACRVFKSGVKMSKKQVEASFGESLNLLNKARAGEVSNSLYVLQKLLGRDFIKVYVKQSSGKEKEFQVPVGTTVRELGVLTTESSEGLQASGARLSHPRVISDGLTARIKNLFSKTYLNSDDAVCQGDSILLDFKEKSVTKEDLKSAIKNFGSLEAKQILERELKEGPAE